MRILKITMGILFLAPIAYYLAVLWPDSKAALKVLVAAGVLWADWWIAGWLDRRAT